MDHHLTINDLRPQVTFQVKDPISALTHFIGFWGALLGLPILLIHATRLGSSWETQISLAIFMMSMILLYGASTSYHTFHISSKADKRLKKLDHMMIFILIAGSYTPVCAIVLSGGIGMRLLALVWIVAALGIVFKAFWVTCPKWVSSIIYIGMGWLAVFAMGPLYQQLRLSCFLWLLAGGIWYTIGGVVYALKFCVLEKYISGFGAHELFHVFVLLGSLCHFCLMYQIV